MKKTTKAEFDRFKSGFNDTAARLGCTGYDVFFVHRELDGHVAACIHVDTGTATVSFNRSLASDTICNDAYEYGVHEAAHLFLSPLMEAAEARFATERELHTSEERTVVALTRALLQPAEE
jgi:hypothetical protein